MDEGRWVVDRRGEPAWEEGGEGFTRGAMWSAAGAVGAGCRVQQAASAALVALIERDAAREEPLPTITGDQIASALARGDVVQRLWGDSWNTLLDGPDEQRWWRHHMGMCEVQARIVEPPPTGRTSFNLDTPVEVLVPSEEQEDRP